MVRYYPLFHVIVTNSSSNYPRILYKYKEINKKVLKNLSQGCFAQNRIIMLLWNKFRVLLSCCDAIRFVKMSVFRISNIHNTLQNTYEFRKKTFFLIKNKTMNKFQKNKLNSQQVLKRVKFYNFLPDNVQGFPYMKTKHSQT